MLNAEMFAGLGAFGRLQAPPALQVAAAKGRCCARIYEAHSPPTSRDGGGGSIEFGIRAVVGLGSQSACEFFVAEHGTESPASSIFQTPENREAEKLRQDFVLGEAVSFIDLARDFGVRMYSVICTITLLFLSSKSILDMFHALST